MVWLVHRRILGPLERFCRSFLSSPIEDMCVSKCVKKYSVDKTVGITAVGYFAQAKIGGCTVG